jgi:hypothetical protein
MAIIDDIRNKIARGQFEFSPHAVDQSIVVSCAISLSKNFAGPSPMAKSVRMIPMTNKGKVA